MHLGIVKMIGRRILIAIPILWVVSVLLFVVLRLLPVDPAAMSMAPNATLEEIAAKRVEMGLDRSLPEQYAIWIGRVLQGDFGTSTHFRRPVIGLVVETLPQTLTSAVTSMSAGHPLLVKEARARASGTSART